MQSPNTFSPLRRERTLSERVAELLLEAILTNQFETGERLPSERDLGEQFGVSRTVIREAVRSLIAKGVLEVRAGSGLKVTRVGADRVRESMTLFLRGNVLQQDLPAGYDKIHEVRETVETRVVVLACERGTEEDKKVLREVLAHMEDNLDNTEVAARADVEFHRQLVRMTYNPLFLVMHDALSDVLIEIRQRTLAIPDRPDQALAEHRLVLESIEAGDPQRACDAMVVHLANSVQAMKELR